MEGDPYCTHCGAHLKWGEDTTTPQRGGDELDDMLNSISSTMKEGGVLRGKSNPT